MFIIWKFLLASLAVASGRRLNERRWADGNGREEEIFHVLLRTKDGKQGKLDQLSKPVRSFKRSKSVSTEVTRQELDELKQDPDVLDIEEDGLVFPDAEDATLYSMKMIQSQSVLLNTSGLDIPLSAACNNPSSFKIGIVDSGLVVGHPDIPCLPIDDENTNCKGTEINLKQGDGLWHNPVKKYHGTHVAGVIGASGTNDMGMHGVISDGNFCFLIARVFGESGSGSRMSDIYEAVEWLLDQGANVINMSLGSGDYSTQGDEIMRQAYAEGALLIASSGNDGTKDEHYPANFERVISVAAVDEDLSKAEFSQYNAGVDIAAPGVGILSTFPPGLGEAVFLSGSGAGAIGKFLMYSTTPDAFSGILVDCPNFGLETCPGDGNHICLIKRGETKFEQKALNCEAGGGIAALIYNNIPGLIGGALGDPTKVTIPVLEIRQVAGEQLLTTSLNEELSVELKSGYGYKSGTSMAVPHVTGVAAKVWRQCPACSNSEVETCMIETSVDLGETGKDVNFGWGLIQAEEAYLCLVNTAGCCRAASQEDSRESVATEAIEDPPIETSNPSAAPVETATPSAVPIETKSPTSAPIRTKIPTAMPVSASTKTPTSIDSVLLPNDMKSVMVEFEALLAHNVSDPEKRLAEIATDDVQFISYLIPSSEELAPLFQRRSGIEALLERIVFWWQNTSIETTQPEEIIFGDSVMQYRLQQSGSLTLAGPDILLDSLTMLRFAENGKIKDIFLTVLNGNQIEEAHASSRTIT